MAWKNQGGPWGGGGNGGGGQGPWGGRDSGGGPSMPGAPDLEELLRRGQDRFRRVLPGGFGGGRVVGLAVLAGVALWFASGFYRVQPGELGVELLFGQYLRITTPGLNYWLPRPIGQVITPNVDRTNQINIGYRGSADVGGTGGARDVPQESLMLTGDQNIIDIDFVVQWRVKSASDFLFNIREPEPTIKIVAESAMREVVGKTTLEDALTVKRQDVEDRTRDLLQTILDEYGAGVLIADVKLQKVDPPAQVIDAFNDVQRARQDKERKQNEALTYSNDILPRAKGEAQRMIQGAACSKLPGSGSLRSKSLYQTTYRSWPSGLKTGFRIITALSSASVMALFFEAASV